MEPGSSLLCSQKPSTSTCPEPDQSSPYHPILFLLRAMFILSSHLYIGLPSGLFLSDFPTKILYVLRVSMHAACPAHLKLWWW
jgi:hypothetical protein